MTPWMQNCPEFNKKKLTHLAKYTLSRWQNVHSRQQDFLFFQGEKLHFDVEMFDQKKFSVDVFCLDNRLEELYLRQAGSAVVNCTFE